ncbi:glycosyltransferase family 2 protein [Amnibacterium kyonggiense]
MSAENSTVVAVLASAGRPQLLADVICDLRSQTRPPDRIVLAVPDQTSVPGTGTDDCQVVFERRGLAAQRNAGMAAAPDAAFYFFFDDDAVVRDDYVERALAHFDDESVVGLTGRVLLDGAASDAIPVAEAREALLRSRSELQTDATRPVHGLYGCNFAVRRLPNMIAFDPRLPLYSWLEDRDFSNRLTRRGSLVRVEDCVIVHLGAKSGGRMAHMRLGYTQVMNPAYFLSKGSFSLRETMAEIGRPVAMNVLRSIWGSERTWRRRRLRGNLIAAASVLRRDLTPERMVDLH